MRSSRWRRSSPRPWPSSTQPWNHSSGGTAGFRPETPPSMSTPRTQRFEARRSAVIAAAVAVINRKGVKGMTLADVAVALGLVPTGVIYYFKNKEDLAAACFLQAIERYNALMDEAEGE